MASCRLVPFLLQVPNTAESGNAPVVLVLIALMLAIAFVCVVRLVLFECSC